MKGRQLQKRRFFCFHGNQKQIVFENLNNGDYKIVIEPRNGFIQETVGVLTLNKLD
jgi:hypothetical protein